MQCREVKRRLNDGEELSEELREHLRHCSHCARAAQADQLLARAVEAARSAESLPATPMATLRNRVASLERTQYGKENSIMSSFRNLFGRRPRLSLGLGAALAVILFVTLVPFSYQRTVGYEVSYDDVTAMPSQTKGVIDALKSIGYERVSISEMVAGGRGDYTITGLPTREAAREAAAVFAQLTGVDAEPSIESVVETVSGSLYAQVRDGLIRIEVDATGKSDAELESEITAKLAANGFTNTQVQVTTAPDGERHMEIFVGDDGSDPNKETEERIELKMGPGDDQTIGFNMGHGAEDSEIRQLIDANKDLSDAELETLIEQKFAERGMPEVDVTVTTMADGKRDIKVTMEKQEWNMDN